MPPHPLTCLMPLSCPLCDEHLHSIWTRDKRRCRFIFCTHCDWDLSLSSNFPTMAAQLSTLEKTQIQYLHTQLHIKMNANHLSN